MTSLKLADVPSPGTDGSDSDREFAHWRAGCFAGGPSYIAIGQALFNWVAWLAAPLYLFSALVLGNGSFPENPASCLLLIWMAAHFGGVAAGKAGLPPLLGMLLSGLCIRNFHICVISEAMTDLVTTGALGVILIRSGLEIDIERVRKAGFVATRLTILPGCLEALAVGGAAHIFFHMPLTLAMSLGFMLAAVSPAVLVNGMFELQRQGLGAAKGLPSLALAAASFDNVIALSGYSMFISLAFPTGSLLQSALHAPMNIALGLMAGCIAGWVATFSGAFSTRWRRTLYVLGSGMGIMYVSQYHECNGAGALGSMCLGAVASHLWKSGLGFSIGSNPEYATDVESHLQSLWDALLQPLLFGVIGAEVDYSKLAPDILPISMGLVALGLLIRVPAAYCSVSGTGFTCLERWFLALSWVPKATVQGALAGLPLEYVHEYKRGSADFELWEWWASVIMTTAVLSIVITAPIGVFAISWLGPRWVTRDGEELKDSAAASPLVGVDGSSSRSTKSNEDAKSAMMVRLAPSKRVAETAV